MHSIYGVTCMEPNSHGDNRYEGVKIQLTTIPTTYYSPKSKVPTTPYSRYLYSCRRGPRIPTVLYTMYSCGGFGLQFAPDHSGKLYMHLPFYGKPYIHVPLHIYSSVALLLYYNIYSYRSRTSGHAHAHAHARADPGCQARWLHQAIVNIRALACVCPCTVSALVACLVSLLFAGGRPMSPHLFPLPRATRA